MARRLHMAPTFARLSALALALSPALALAAPATTHSLDLRLRQETVDDASFAKDAAATTLRLRAGLQHAFNEHFVARIEFEGTQHLGSERFNSTANGVLDHPAVVD